MSWQVKHTHTHTTIREVKPEIATTFAIIKYYVKGD